MILQIKEENKLQLERDIYRISKELYNILYGDIEQ